MIYKLGLPGTNIKNNEKQKGALLPLPEIPPLYLNLMLHSYHIILKRKKEPNNANLIAGYTRTYCISPEDSYKKLS